MDCRWRPQQLNQNIMRKILFAALLLLGSSLASQAQTIYQTKTGKVSFFSRTPVEDIDAHHSTVEARLASSGQLVVMLLVKGFVFQNELMGQHFQDNHLESSKYPKAAFMGQLVDASAVNFAKDGSYPVQAKGSLQLHGVKKDVVMNGQVVVKNGKPQLKATFPIKLTDYNVKGHEKVAKEIEVKVDCSLQ
jgi:hypothetical protein